MTRADDLKRMLDNARHPGESMKAYRNRRVLSQVSVAKHLKGRRFYVPGLDKQGKAIPYRKEVA
jgi:hypothetical protein